MSIEDESISLNYYTQQLQRHCDKIAGLKVKNSQLENEIKRLTHENKILSSELSQLKENYLKLKDDYEVMLREFECLDDSYKLKWEKQKELFFYEKVLF